MAETLNSTMINTTTNRNLLIASLVLIIAVISPTTVFAAVTGVEFQAVYDFIFDAATGYLGRSIAIAGGLIGLGFGAASGKPVIAIVGIVLAIFGALGPAIINTIFGSALV